MNTPLFCLTLASLLLAPALCVEDAPEDYWMFRYYHTNIFSAFSSRFECTPDMTRKQRSTTYCIPTSSIILGDTSDITPNEDVLNICRGQGTPLGDQLFRSNKNFRVVKCRLQDRTAVPPNCAYKPLYEVGQIIVGCSQGYPVHFEGF